MFGFFNMELEINGVEVTMRIADAGELDVPRFPPQDAIPPPEKLPRLVQRPTTWVQPSTSTDQHELHELQNHLRIPEDAIDWFGRG